MARDLVTIAQAAQARQWATERYVRWLIETHAIPHHKLGAGRTGKVLVDLSDLDAFAEAGRIEARPTVAGLRLAGSPAPLKRGRPRKAS